MKANVADRYGNPDILKVLEVEKPVPRENEILVKVSAATVNRTDCAILKGIPKITRLIYGITRPKNKITGIDFSGIIEAVGDGVKKYGVGDKIFGFDDMGIKSHAEYLTIAEDNAINTIPEGISFEEATASIEGAHYAYNMINKFKFTPGDKVLVNGASGAIGSAAVQLLKHSGMDVTAVCNTKNIELIKSIGANHVFDYEKEDFTQTKEKFKCILDTVGKSSFSKCKPILIKGGAYISSELGKNSENIFYSLFTPIFSSKKVLFPVPLNRNKSVELIRGLLQGGNFKPLIDKTYTLENSKEAFLYVDSGKKTGNVVITI